MKEHNWQENSQPRFPPQKTDQTPSQRRAKVWEWEAESWRCLSPVVTIPKVGGTQDMIETPSSMAHALPPARSQRSYQLCRGDYHAINLCYEWSRKPDLPLGVWKIQKWKATELWSLEPGWENAIQGDEVCAIQLGSRWEPITSFL